MGWSTSARWAQALQASVTVATVVDVWLDGVLQQAGIGVHGGDVDVDEASKVRRSLNLTVADLDLDPRDASDLLAPFGTELRVRTGIRFTEGDVELVPAGVFRLQDVGRSGWFDDQRLVGKDYSKVLADARFLAPWNTTAGTGVVAEITRMVHDVLPAVEVFDLTGSLARCRAAVWERDRWDAIENLAAGIGAEPYFDAAGRLIIRPVPTVANAGEPQAVYDGTGERGVLYDAATGMSVEGLYNAVVATGDPGGDAPTVTGVAYQLTGPLRWRDGFKRPRFYSTPVVTTVEGIQAAAASILARSVAYSRRIDPVTAPDAARDVGDPVTVILPDGTESTRIISRIRLPLGDDEDDGDMPLATRVDPDAAVTDDPGSLS